VTCSFAGCCANRRAEVAQGAQICGHTGRQAGDQEVLPRQPTRKEPREANACTSPARWSQRPARDEPMWIEAEPGSRSICDPATITSEHARDSPGSAQRARRSGSADHEPNLYAEQAPARRTRALCSCARREQSEVRVSVRLGRDSIRSWRARQDVSAGCSVMKAPPLLLQLPPVAAWAGRRRVRHCR